MTWNIFRHTIVYGVALAGLGVVGGPQAHATPYAFAQNQLTNFQILVDSGTVVIQSASRNTINTANYTLTLREPERIDCQSVRSGFC